jgi:transposase
VICSQLIAEIGDVTKLKSGKSLIALAGIDPPPNQSGKDDPKSRSISKRGSPALRKTIFLIMTIYLQRKPDDEPVYQFLDKKRSEGKPYKVYMVAAAHKFLRIYYARIKEAMPVQ